MSTFLQRLLAEFLFHTRDNLLRKEGALCPHPTEIKLKQRAERKSLRRYTTLILRN